MTQPIYITIDGTLHKRCTSSNGCGEVKVADGNFHKHTRKGSGTLHYNSICKECYRAYQRQRHQDCYTVEPYGDLVVNVPWPGTGRPIVAGIMGYPA